MVRGQGCCLAGGRKDGEDRVSDDSLNGFESCCEKLRRPGPVGAHLKQVSERGDETADQHDGDQRRGSEPEMAETGQGHEEMRGDQQADGAEGGGNRDYS